MTLTTFRQWLLTVDGIPALVSDRIYQGAAPDQSERPYIVLSQTARRRIVTNTSIYHVGPATLEVACVATRRTDAQQLADLVSAAVAARPTLTGAASIEPDSEYDASNLDPAATIHTVVQTYRIHATD